MKNGPVRLGKPGGVGHQDRWMPRGARRRVGFEALKSLSSTSTRKSAHFSESRRHANLHSQLLRVSVRGEDEGYPRLGTDALKFST